MATKNLAAVITIGGTVTGGLKAALGDTGKQLRAISDQIGDMNRRSRTLGSAIKAMAVDGRNGVDGLRRSYAETIATVEKLRQAQQRLATAQARHDRLRAIAGIDHEKMTLKRAGVGATVAGGAMIASVVPGVNEAKHYQTEMGRMAALGMGADVNKKAVKFAKDMKTYGTSSLENLELMRDGMSVFADLHHAEMVLPLLAKMKFGNKAVFGAERGEQQSQQFMDMLKVIETRGGLKSEAEFSKQANIIQQVISATGGRVSATEWRHMLMTGGLAGKSMDSEALFYTFEHLVQEMGGDRAGTGLNSLYKSLYQGVAKKRSVLNLERFGLIGDKKKVKHDKAGQVSSMEPGALLGSDLFRANPFQWMEQVLLPQLAKKGITDEKKVIDTIGMIVSNSVGGSFLAEMYRQRENIHRAEKRNRGAQNVDQLVAEGQGTAVGKEIDAQAKLADAKLNMGNAVLPLYTEALIKATDALKWLNEQGERHGTWVKAAAIGVAGLGAALVVLGPLLTAGAGLMTLYAAAQLRAAAAATSAAAAISTENAAMAAQNGLAGGGKFGKVLGIAAKVGTAAVLSDLALSGAKAAGLPDVTDDTQKQGEQELRDGKWFKASLHMSAGSWLKGMVSGAPPAPPALPAAQPPAAPAIGTQQNTFHITQQPGENSEQLARQIEQQLRLQLDVKRRSALTDGASPQ